VPTRLVQRYVRLFKRQRDGHQRRRIERCRVSVEVLARDVIWVQDGWHMGRLMDGRALESQLFKDRGSLRTVCWDIGLAQSQEDLIAQLEAMRLSRGLPLVVSSDNLSSCCGRLVQAYLEYYEVIHLLSLPRTPQHNGAAECHIRELREVTGFRKGMLHGGVVEPASRLLCAVGQLDGRLRASKGYKTAVELDAALPMGYNVVGRARFYREACKRMKTAVLGARSWREARMAEREAVYATLECFGLVRRVRGGQPYPRPSGAIFS
jgi:transposase InsO family protein